MRNYMKKVQTAACIAAAAAIALVTARAAIHTCSHAEIVDANRVATCANGCSGWYYDYGWSVCIGYGSAETTDCNQVNIENVKHSFTATCTGGVCTAPIVSSSNTACQTPNAANVPHIGPPC